MGLIMYPVFRTPIPDVAPRTTGEFLAAECETLDRVAFDYGPTPLAAFADPREVPPDFDGPPWELDEVLGPCEDWFPASAGRVAVAALTKLVRGPESGRLESPTEVAGELDDLARILAAAESVGAEFRLTLG